MFHRVDVANRLLWIECMNDVASGRGDVRRLTTRVNNESHERITQLRMRPVRHRLRLAIKRHILAVSYHPNDFAGQVFVFHINRHAFTQGVFVR